MPVNAEIASFYEQYKYRNSRSQFTKLTRILLAGTDRKTGSGPGYESLRRMTKFLIGFFLIILTSLPFS